MLRIMFRIPMTTQCVVLWKRDGVMYRTIAPHCADNYRLRDFMALERHVNWHEIRAVEPHGTPLPSVTRRPYYLATDTAPAPIACYSEGVEK